MARDGGHSQTASSGGGPRRPRRGLEKPQATSATFAVSCMAVIESGMKRHLVLPLVGVPHVQLTAITVGAYPIAVFAEIHGGHLPGQSIN